MNFSYQKDITLKRVKERSVKEAYYLVQIWRKFYMFGIPDENGILRKATLQQAADATNVPKKTLEDYTQIFKKVKLIAHLDDFANKKMGVLRAFMKKNKSKIRKAVQNDREHKLKKKFDRQNQLEDDFISNEQTINQCKQEENQIEENQIKMEIVKEEEDDEMKMEYESSQYSVEQNSCCMFFTNQQLNYYQQQY